MKNESSLPTIPCNGTLKEWQSYVKELVRARGWTEASDLEVFLLFSEEVGELAKAFRRHRELFTEGPESHSKAESKKELASEMADVLSYLLDLAQRMDIDLEDAAVAKERFNRTREWT